MGIIKSYEDLEIYQLSLELAVDIYKLTETLPKEEIYGLRDQIRRAASSVGANIAEGWGRFHYKDRLIFLYNSRGSLYEVKHFTELSLRLGYIKKENKDKIFTDIEKLSIKLNNFIFSIKENINNK
jgi:four helix bundle protein